MLIVCPACASAYEIEASHVGADGRSVRCAACRETWFVGPGAAADASEVAGAAADWEGDRPDAAVRAAGGPAAEGGPAESSAPEPSAGPKRRGAARLPPALAAGLAVFALVPLALLGRTTVVRAMPQTASLFAGIGLPVNLRGVDLRDIFAFRKPAEGDRPGELVVEGDLVGAGRGRAEVLPVEIVVRDDHGQPLYRWCVPAPRVALEPGETARFRASLSAPPPQGRRVEVRFADRPAEAGHARVADETTADAAAGSSAPQAASAGH